MKPATKSEAKRIAIQKKAPPAAAPADASMRETLHAAGWLVVSDAAKLVGKTVQWVHAHMKADAGPLTEKEKGSMRIEYLYFVFEPALRDILGDTYSDLRGIRTRAQIKSSLPGKSSK